MNWMSTKTTLWQKYKRHDKYCQLWTNFTIYRWELAVVLAVGAWNSRRDDVKNQVIRTKETVLKANAFRFSSRNIITKLKTNQLTHEITAGVKRVGCAPLTMGVPHWMLGHKVQALNILAHNGRIPFRRRNASENKRRNSSCSQERCII